MNNEIARDNLTSIKSVLERHEIVFWLDWGTCLGAIKEGNLMGHDYDIDLGIIVEDGEKLKALMPELNAKGFEEVKPWEYLGIKLKRREEDIDIFFVSKVNTSEIKENERQKSGWMNGGLFIEGDWFKEFDTVELSGETYRVPQNPVAYLTYIYGPSWQLETVLDFWDYNPPIQKPVSREIRRDNWEAIAEVFQRHNIRFWVSTKTDREEIKADFPTSDDPSLNLPLKINASLEDKEKIINAVPELMQSGFTNLKISQIRKFFRVSRRSELIDIEFVNC